MVRSCLLASAAVRAGDALNGGVVSIDGLRTNGVWSHGCGASAALSTVVCHVRGFGRKPFRCGEVDDDVCRQVPLQRGEAHPTRAGDTGVAVVPQFNTRCRAADQNVGFGSVNVKIVEDEVVSVSRRGRGVDVALEGQTHVGMVGLHEQTLGRVKSNQGDEIR